MSAAPRSFDIDERREEAFRLGEFGKYGVDSPCFKPRAPPGQPFCTPRGGLFIVGPICDEIGH